MGFKVNFSETETNNFEAIPRGTYPVKITDGEVKESGPNAKNPGSEYIKFEFTVQEGPYEGRKLWANASLLPHALFTLKGILAASGKYTDEELEATELDFEIEDLIGAAMLVTVAVRDYNGEEQNDIKRYKKIDGANSQAAPSASALP